MEKYVVLGDVHARYRHVEAVINRYKGQEVTLITVGDVVDGVDGSDTKRTIELLIGCGAINVFGNHEWVLAATLYADNEEDRREWASNVWSGYQSGVLSSYGLTEPNRLSYYSDNYWYEAANALQSSIAKSKHKAFFTGLVPYFETEDFVVVHGGLVMEKSWQKQKNELDSWASVAFEERNWSLEPEQIMDPEFVLSKTTISNIPEKSLVTGHDHTRENSLQRATDNGKRIRLGGDILVESPLYIWESWRSNVVPISC